MSLSKPVTLDLTSSPEEQDIMKARLDAITQFDGRYKQRLGNVANYFSEGAYFRYRLIVEIKWIKYLATFLPELQGVDLSVLDIDKIDMKTATIRMCEIEKKTRHDVKAVELTLGEVFDHLGLEKIKSHIHIGLTSNDVNSMAYSMMIWEFVDQMYTPMMEGAVAKLKEIAIRSRGTVMLCLTHGQPATPSTFGEQMEVFVESLEEEIESLKAIKRQTKFGGATGGFNAMKVSHPDVEWTAKLNEFCTQMGFERQQKTTQVMRYVAFSRVFDLMARVNTTLLAHGWDMWGYISLGWLMLKIVSGEVGSSTMPHKVNPIDFENMNGNLIVVNGILRTLSDTLPVRRFQRDLADSTMMRWLGIVMSGIVLAFDSLMKGLDRIEPNDQKMADDLSGHWEVLGEAVQTVLRKHGVTNAYDLIKDATRNGVKFDQAAYREMVGALPDVLPAGDRQKLMDLTPISYGAVVA